MKGLLTLGYLQVQLLLLFVPSPLAAVSLVTNLAAFAPIASTTRTKKHGCAQWSSTDTKTAASTGKVTRTCSCSSDSDSTAAKIDSSNDNDNDSDNDNDNENCKEVLFLFQNFASFLQTKQNEITKQIEDMDGSGQTFSRDTWGIFQSSSTNGTTNENESGGITRVIQGGNVVEKGACSLTILRNGKLSAERAAAIRGRQGDHEQAQQIKEGDIYSAAALSIVLHTRSPFVPTFRSDVRIFMVQPTHSSTDDGRGCNILAWFGGGADLTPYYLFDEDIISFHQKMKRLCDSYSGVNNNDGDNNGGKDAYIRNQIDYKQMKQACDEYFYLPARSEHRGVGGIFFDDLPASDISLSFVRDVVDSWMPAWFPIINKRQSIEYSEKQRQWQLLRRGRYLEFNLLYDRGVKFGLANANPRVEGVMVSAPPLIAWEYNHQLEEGSEEARLMSILKYPIEWIQ